MEVFATKVADPTWVSKNLHGGRIKLTLTSSPLTSTGERKEERKDEREKGGSEGGSEGGKEEEGKEKRKKEKTKNRASVCIHM